MKKSVMSGLAAALVVVAAGGCSKQEQKEDPQADARGFDARSADVERRPLTGPLWKVCGYTPDPPGPHAPPPGGKFEIVQTASNSGVYALNLEDPSKWDAGWQALTLAKQGTKVARIPHADWTAGCEPGDNSETMSFAPTTDTMRYRGATCLPDGAPQHATGTCSNGKENFHEIIIYVHQPTEGSTDTPHMMMQYCGRDELDKAGLTCVYEADNPEAKYPHPGHVHIDP